MKLRTVAALVQSVTPVSRDTTPHPLRMRTHNIETLHARQREHLFANVLSLLHFQTTHVGGTCVTGDDVPPQFLGVVVRPSHTHRLSIFDTVGTQGYTVNVFHDGQKERGTSYWWTLETEVRGGPLVPHHPEARLTPSEMCWLYEVLDAVYEEEACDETA